MEGVSKLEAEIQPVTSSGNSPVSDEVTDLKQRLSVLQGKRAEDKVRIKELEKYKAHYLQVYPTRSRVGLWCAF